MTQLNKSDNGSNINTQIGEIIEIKLEENPTTGYIWKIVSFDEEQLINLDNTFAIVNNAIGSAGVRTYFFEVINNGNSIINLSLGNPWEQDSIDTFLVTIKS